jgi:1,4-alpha-glucan branching enzyme
MVNEDRLQGFDKFGFNVDGNNTITYREWAPNAKEAFLIGDFSTFMFLLRPPSASRD